MSLKPSGTAAMFSTNRNLEITNLFALVAGGIIIKIIFNAQGPANATIWGYSLSAIAVFLLLIISIAFSNNNYPTQENILNIFIKFALPPALLLILLIWTIGQTITFFKKINSGILPEEFSIYSFISSFLIIVQAINLYMFYNEEYGIQIVGQKRKSKQQIESLNIQDEIENIDNSSLMYILTIINSVILGMMQIVLTFFTTDG